MPVRNGLKKKSINGTNLKDAINSILQQTYKNLEIIISDDCSDNETKDYLKDISKNDQRIKLFFQEENLGWEKNFKFILDKSKGEYFKWACQDDIISEDYIYSNYNFLKNNPDYVSSSSKFCYENKPEKIFSFNLDQNLYERIKNFFKFRHISHNVIYSLIRTEKIKNTIDLSKQYWAIDWIINLELLLEGKFKTVENGLVKYGIHGFSKNKEYLKKENLTKKKIYKILPFYELMKNLFLKTFMLKELSIFEKVSIYISSFKINLYFFKKNLWK